MQIYANICADILNKCKYKIFCANNHVIMLSSWVVVKSTGSECLFWFEELQFRMGMGQQLGTSIPSLSELGLSENGGTHMKNQRFEQGNIGFSVNPWILECLIFRHIMTVIMTYSAMNMAMNWTPMVPSRHQDGLSFLDSCLGSRQRELCFERFFKRKTTRTLDELNRPYSIWILRDELNELTITYQLFWCSPKAPLF